MSVHFTLQNGLKGFIRGTVLSLCQHAFLVFDWCTHFVQFFQFWQNKCAFLVTVLTVITCCASDEKTRCHIVLKVIITYHILIVQQKTWKNYFKVSLIVAISKTGFFGLERLRLHFDIFNIYKCGRVYTLWQKQCYGSLHKNFFLRNSTSQDILKVPGYMMSEPSLFLSWFSIIFSKSLWMNLTYVNTLFHGVWSFESAVNFALSGLRIEMKVYSSCKMKIYRWCRIQEKSLAHKELSLVVIKYL